MEKLFVYLIAIGVVLYVIYLIIVYIVVPILGILFAIGLLIIGGIALAGFVSGIYLGIKNFFEVLQEAHSKLI